MQNDVLTCLKTRCEPSRLSLLIPFSVTEVPDKLPMLAILGYMVRARSHKERMALNTIAASATRTAGSVVVSDQLDTAQGAEALRDIQKRTFRLFVQVHLWGRDPPYVLTPKASVWLHR